MAHRKRLELIITEQAEEIVAEHADAVCFRCKVRLTDHQGADHLFFEHPNEAPEEQSN